MPSKPLSSGKATELHTLASDTACYAGDPLAVVLATSRYAAVVARVRAGLQVRAAGRLLPRGRLFQMCHLSCTCHAAYVL